MATTKVNYYRPGKVKVDFLFIKRSTLAFTGLYEHTN